MALLAVLRHPVLRRVTSTVAIAGSEQILMGVEDDRVLVFDVNETLIDLESLTPTFERIFGDPAAMRTWFGEVITYSMTVTLAGCYTDFFSLGRAVLRMVGHVRGVEVTEDDEESLGAALRAMPATPTSNRGCGHCAIGGIDW